MDWGLKPEDEGCDEVAAVILVLYSETKSGRQKPGV